MSRSEGLGEDAAREVVWLQAFESIEPASPSWGADDAAWATRAAREAADATPDAFLATRAALAMQRLRPREPALAAGRRRGGGRWLGAAIAVGLVAGLAADAVGTSQRINLLAPPVWTVVAWNLAVYVLLIGAAVRHALGAPARGPGALARVAERLAGGDAPATVHGTTAAAVRFFAARWSVVAGPLVALRAALLLHAAAAALGVGLVAGLYARGLVLDYRVAWESTFLSPAEVHAVLSALLGPASALSGLALPDVAAVAGLRAAHGDAAVGAPAASWIHLYALTLALAVVLPRCGLAALAAARARRAAAHLHLPLDDAYFRRLELERRGTVARARLHPYAQPPAATAIDGARALLAQVLGSDPVLDVAPTTPFGGEDDMAVASGAADIAVALFDLGATPEREHQGRFVDALAHDAAPGTTTIVLVDEGAFRRRFGADSRRVGERRAAWEQLFATGGTVPVFADLGAPPGAVPSGALRRALGRTTH